MIIVARKETALDQGRSQLYIDSLGHLAAFTMKSYTDAFGLKKRKGLPVFAERALASAELFVVISLPAFKKFNSDQSMVGMLVLKATV